MRKIFAALVVLFFAVSAPLALASSFDSFDQKIAVREDASFRVVETVKVDFDEPRHGIYRDIPIKYKTESGNPFSIAVSVRSVSGLNGAPLPYTLGREGDALRVKIGDPDVVVTGPQTYVIAYDVKRALLFLSDGDQLYWNVVVAAWGDLGLPVKVSASVVLPSPVGKDKIKTRCFSGLGVGSPEDCTIQTSDAGAIYGSVGQFNGAMLTIVFGWPKGIVHEPSLLQKLGSWLADNWIIFWPVLVFFFLYFRWRKYGRDPKISGPLVVEYEPPAGAAPAELSVLAKGRAGLPDISATIVHLAARGYLLIEETQKKNLFGTNREYVFELKKTFAQAADLLPFERAILEKIFNGQVGERVELKSLENVFYKFIPAIKTGMSQAAVERGWYGRSPMSVRASYVTGAVIYGFIVYSLASFFARGFVGLLFFASVGLPIVFILFFGWIMPARTKSGAAAYMKMAGFKEFISKAEKYRAKWAERENIFFDFLPYAMVFGVSDKWAKAFEGLAKNPPDWYHGSSGAMWSTLYFTNSLSAATASIGHALATAPSSRGGGGFGGGGGGGGGFGGGGGGSW